MTRKHAQHSHRRAGFTIGLCLVLLGNVCFPLVANLTQALADEGPAWVTLCTEGGLRQVAVGTPDDADGGQFRQQCPLCPECPGCTATATAHPSNPPAGSWQFGILAEKSAAPPAIRYEARPIDPLGDPFSPRGPPLLA